MFREVQPDVFWFHPPDGGEVHVARTDDGLALFDSGFFRHRQCLVDEMRTAGLDPHDIRLGFITHFHADHAGGMGWWREQFDFPVVAHQHSVEPVETADKVITGARIPFTAADSEFIPCPIAHRVEGGECFTVGDRAFKVISAFGHTAGSIHISSGELLFVGDTIYADGAVGWIDVHWGSNPEDYIETLERMRAYRGFLALPGHGTPFKLTDAHIDHARKIVSFYIPLGHGLGSPRVPSQYAAHKGKAIQHDRSPHPIAGTMKAKAVVFREPNVPLLEEITIPDLQPGEIRTRERPAIATPLNGCCVGAPVILTSTEPCVCEGSVEVKMALPLWSQWVMGVAIATGYRGVRTLYSGVSIGTESSIFSGIRTQNGTFPLVGGYMASGIVEEIGPEVTGFSAGDRVVAGGSRLDGDINSVWGSHLAMQIVAAANALKAPEKTDMKEAAMHILPRVGLHAVTMSGINEHDTALIIGQGMIGQFFGQFARIRGAKVITVEPNRLRAELSREYVTEHVLDPVNDDVVQRVEEITGGAGPGIVVEATGSAGNIDSATGFLRRHGKMVFLSWYPGKISMNFAHFHNNEVTAYFPTGAGDQQTARAVLECLGNGAIVIGKNLTDIIHYHQACDGYRRIINGDKSIMGMVIDWTKA